jgi:hypothetical protein
VSAGASGFPLTIREIPTGRPSNSVLTFWA